MNFYVAAMALGVFALFTSAVVAAIKRGRMSLAHGCGLIGQNLLLLLAIVLPVSKRVKLFGIAVLVVVFILADLWSRRRRRAAEPGIAADRASPGR